MRAIAIAVLIAAALFGTACKVNEYCLNCETGDANHGDGNGDDGGTGDDGGGGDGGGCVPTGPEVCDGKDNDCNGIVDDGILPEVGDACANQLGECAGGVKVCVAGAIKCSKEPSAEQCDGKDNNCNGVADEGDPGGGAKCGTDVGECVAGTMHCNLTTHVVECIGAVGTVNGQPEICNGRDDDCDGTIDEDLTNLGACGSSVGECKPGTKMCLGGGVVCVGNTGPAFEACDNKDNDCDGKTDEDTDKNTDPRNCGACNHVCSLPHAFEGCSGGNCTIAACEQGFFDVDTSAADGCEYGPCTIQGSEVCNGQDDDCNGQIDDGVVVPPGLCSQVGACAGSTATCEAANGFRCNYGPDVSVDANGNITAETLCDGIDNDCDGKVDEGQPNLGQACNDNGVGVCKGSGTFQCNPANPSGPAICVITTPGQTASSESCDGLDNDCDGVVDNGAETGNLPGQDWVTIPGSTTQIQKWEASRPGATATAVGTNEARVCSKQGVQPWTNIKYPQAVAACASIGARLCTEAEWQSMCAQPPPAPTYPVAGPTGTTDHVVIEAELAQTRTPGAQTAAGISWQNEVPGTSNFSGATDLRALPGLNNIQISASSAPSQSPRLDFPVSFATSTSYFVWVRIYAENSGDNAVWTGINTTAPGAVEPSQTQLAPNQNQFWQWVRSPAIAVTAGTRVVSVYMRRDGVRVDAISISRDGTNPPVYDDKIWAYQNNPKFAQPQICNGNEFDTNTGQTGDQDDILATGSLPQCFANGPGGADAFDMSGNVKEWTTARALGQNPIRGGSANNDVNGLSCGLNFTLADDNFFFPNVGFRCCR